MGLALRVDFLGVLQHALRGVCEQCARAFHHLDWVLTKVPAGCYNSRREATLMKQILYTSDIGTVETYVEREVIDYINQGQIETFESFDGFDIVAFDWYDINDVDVPPSQIMVYIDADDIFFFCENDSALRRANELFRDDANDSNERTLYEFFLRLFKDDVSSLEKLEDEITEADDALITGRREQCTQDIVHFRKRLLRLKKYYEQLHRIFEALTENDNGLISSDSLRYFVILERRVDRMLASVVNMREYVTQVREAYQAQVDIEQNNLMRIFTVVTSIFLPLTLLVGWYGMNFPMPEFTWKYGYLSVIVASVTIGLVCVAIFKRKKWF